MTIPKFKIGDRVKWRDHEGHARSGVIVELPFGCPAQFGTLFIKEAQELQPVRWHESHLSLDVPEPKQFATDREAEFGVEIIDLHYQVADQKKEIKRLTGLNTKHLHDSLELSRRLTEEIGGRHRERIAKEAAQKESADAKNSVSNNYNAFVRGCESLTAAQKKNSQLTASLEALKSGIDKLSELASEVAP